MSAYASVLSPLTLEAFETKSDASRELVGMIEEGIESDGTGGKLRWRPGFPPRLEKLLEALPLDPSTDDACLRLWFLQLCHRAEEFGKACRWQFRNDLKAVRDYRDTVAHPGVDRMDTVLLRTFQKDLFRIIKSRL